MESINLSNDLWETRKLLVRNMLKYQDFCKQCHNRHAFSVKQFHLCPEQANYNVYVNGEVQLITRFPEKLNA